MPAATSLFLPSLHHIRSAQNKPITCLLLGDSMFERFKSTGIATLFGSSAQYPEYFNAGVGGDRILRVIYRLTTKGLLQRLKEWGVKYALLAMGANDLANGKKSLSPENIKDYRTIIEGF